MSNVLHLPVDLCSPDQLSMVVLELRAYIGKLRDAAVRAKAGSAAEAPEAPEASPLLTSLLEKSGISANDVPALEAATTELQQLMTAAPTVHITLAGFPNRTLKRQLAVWFRTQIHPSVLLTFAVRSDIGGGIIVQAGSHFYDLSFKHALLANKQRISELAGV